MGERDRRLAGWLAGWLTRGGRLARRQADLAARSLALSLALSLSRTRIRLTDGGTDGGAMHYLRLRIRRGRTRRGRREGGAHPRDENSGRTNAYQPVAPRRRTGARSLPRRREVSFARRGIAAYLIDNGLAFIPLECVTRDLVPPANVETRDGTLQNYTLYV